MAETKNVVSEVKWLNFSRIVVLIFYWFAIIASVFLGLAFVMLLFGANPATPFVKFIYNTAYDFMAPFRGIFPTHTLSSAHDAYFSPSALFAMIMYLLGAYLISSLVTWIESKIALVQKEGGVVTPSK